MPATRDVRAATNATLTTTAAFNAAAVDAATARTPQDFLGDAVAQLGRLLGACACSILVENDGVSHCAATVGVTPDQLRASGEDRLPDDERWDGDGYPDGLAGSCSPAMPGTR